jgi:hypothetical protein
LTLNFREYRRKEDQVANTLLLAAANLLDDPELVERLHAVTWPDVPLATFREEMRVLTAGMRELDRLGSGNDSAEP